MSVLNKSFYEHDGGYSWIVLIFIIINNISCMGLMFATVGPLTKEYAQLLNIDLAEANVIGSVLLGVALFTVPINSALIKLFGCHVISGVGALLSIGGFLSSAFATEVWHLILGYSVLAGLGFSMNMTSSISIVPHYFKKRSRVAYMSAGLGQGVAKAALPIVLSSMLSILSYKRTIIYMLPIVSCCASAPIIFRPKHKQERPSSATQFLKSYVHPLKRYVTPFYLLNSFLWNSGHSAVTILLYSHVAGISGEETATLIQTVFGIAQAVGGVTLTLILFKFRLNHYKLLIACNVTAGVACILLGVFTHDVAMFVASGVIGFCHAVTVGNMACACQHLYPGGDIEYAFGFLEIAGGIGGFFGSYSAGWLQQQFGNSSGFYYLGSLMSFGGILLVVAALIRKEVWWPYQSMKTSKCDNSSTVKEETADSVGTEGYVNESFKTSMDLDDYARDPEKTVA